MTWEIIFMLGLLVVLLAAFVWEKLPIELSAMAAFALLLGVGLLSPEAAMAVFGNPGPIAVGAMFVISAALEKCGAIEVVARGLNRMPKLPLMVVIPALVLTVAAVSAFINNTPVVVVFLPIVVSLAQRMEIAPSKLLIPLSYASIFGGSCTLVGTSTNIVVSSIATERGFAGFGMFELAAVGVPLVLLGALYLTLLGPKLLPERQSVTSVLPEEERREYLVEAFVKDGSPLIGCRLQETAFGEMKDLRVLEVRRHDTPLRADPGDVELRAGDRLLMAASPRAVPRAQEEEGVDLLDSVGEGLESISLNRGAIVEGVVGPDSYLAGRTLRALNFRQRYNLIPIAIHRRGRSLRLDFDKLSLDFGDTLLLLGTSEAFEAMRGNQDILFLDRPPLVMPARRRKLPLILAVIAGVITAAALGFLPLASAAIVGSVVLLLTGCLTPRQAYESIQWPILFLIFSMLGVGAAMESTGTSAFLATQMVDLVSAAVAEAWRPLALLAGVYLLTTTLTELLSNNAAAVLMGTLAIGVAESIGADPRPFLIVVAVAASASFATPIGYQTNTYIYGVGGYRFIDFPRIGIPLNFLAFLLTIAIVPFVWEL